MSNGRTRSQAARSRNAKAEWRDLETIDTERAHLTLKRAINDARQALEAGWKSEIMTALEFKQARERLGLSIRDLAEVFDCHPRTIMRIEEGEGPTRITELAMRYLAISVDSDVTHG